MRARRRLIISISIFLLFLLIVGIIVGHWLREKAAYYSEHFAEGTIINGLDVSGSTVPELVSKIQEYQITIEERNSGGGTLEEQITGEEIDLQPADADDLNDILESQDNLEMWLAQRGKTYELDSFMKYDEEKMMDVIHGLMAFQKEYNAAPTDAYISEYQSGKGYEIIPETQGNQLLADKAEQLIKEAIDEKQTEINLSEEDCYEKPKITSDNQEMNDYVNKINKFVNVVISYDFGEDQVVINGDLINDWLIINGDEIQLDRNQVYAYIVEMKKKYDTIFRPRTFKTTAGPEITIDGGDYGWWMDYETEAAQVADMIEAGESGEREPVYFQKANSHGKNDYGDYYVEINLTAQHLYIYKDGKQVLDTDIVSGNESKNYGTPAGVYSMTYKEEDAVLVGEDYHQPVSYWMPFNLNIGIHDALWRSEFGQNFYKTDGSHGCINLPYLTAQKVYSLVEEGMPVICYYLEGTESNSITRQEPAEKAQAVIDAINKIGDLEELRDDKNVIIDRARELYKSVDGSVQALVSNYEALVNAENAYKEKYGKTVKQTMQNAS